MSNLDNSSAQLVDKPVEKSFAEQVDEVVTSVTKDEHGKQIFPEGIDESVKFAATAELRRRHTQSEFDKNRQALAAREAENEALKKLAVPTLKLTVEQKEELEDLKSTDVDAWRAKITEYETAAKAEIDKELEGVTLTAAQEAEKERRRQVLENFSDANPELVLNNEVLANDIPPRIKTKIEKGEITFEEFLVECKDYLVANKKPATDDLPNDPNLNDVGGGTKATQTAVEGDILQSYEKAIF